VAKAAKSDRQKVIDDIKKKQKGAEKRRGMMIVGVCVVIALLIVGAAAYRPVMNWWELRQFNDVDLASIGAAADACGEVTTKAAEGSNDHRTTGEQITYGDAPVAFGPHWNEQGVAPAPIDDRFYTSDDRPELESLVHNLEHGYTILWYDETAAADGDTLVTIEGIAKKLDVSDTNFRFKFIAAPWTSADEEETGKKFPEGQHIAFTHWKGGDKPVGVWQYCSEPSGEALETFMKDYPYTDSPEPDAM
jgi:hypothetical protein